MLKFKPGQVKKNSSASGHRTNKSHFTVPSNSGSHSLVSDCKPRKCTVVHSWDIVSTVAAAIQYRGSILASFGDSGSRKG